MRNIILSFLCSVLILTGSCSKNDDDNLVVSDIDGNIYHLVGFGRQVWLKENLKTTRYRNGDIIGTTSPATLDISQESEPKYQWAYNGYESNADEYGRLYTWYAVNDSRGICPEGYHVPGDNEWSLFIQNLGGDSIAGGKLKETGTEHWEFPNLSATDSIGFKALPGGNRGNDGKFYNMGNFGLWWSSTEATDETAWHRLIYSGNSNMERYPYFKYNAYSVRCVKD